MDEKGVRPRDIRTLDDVHRLPFTELKIDMQFVQAAETDGVARAIVENSIELAKQLGMKVIAEGVETEAQREFLDRNGCYALQGYLLGRPVPVEEFERGTKTSLCKWPKNGWRTCRKMWTILSHPVLFVSGI